MPGVNVKCNVSNDVDDGSERVLLAVDAGAFASVPCENRSIESAVFKSDCLEYSLKND